MLRYPVYLRTHSPDSWPHLQGLESQVTQSICSGMVVGAIKIFLENDGVIVRQQ